MGHSYDKKPLTIFEGESMQCKIAEIYYALRCQYMADYKGYFMDEFTGQNLLIRKATIYAIKNSVRVWRIQQCS